MIPTPGWIAMQAAGLGTPLAIAVLGVAITMEEGNASDVEINAYYEHLAGLDDTVYELNAYYRELEARWPFLVGFLGGITGWTEQPGWEQYDQVREFAGKLVGIQWSETEPQAGGDILGRVKNQLDSIGHRRTKVFDYTSIDESMVEWLATAEFRPVGRIVDAWCGSGTRIIGAYRYQQLVGGRLDIPIIANDPSSLAIAMTGLNLVGYGITDNVELKCSREWAEYWGTSTFYGRAPSIRRTLPPELAADVPSLKEEL